ncbi:YtxH domain-containing protein [Acetobacterium wieringae]|uniref:YtxH domain-containing protein n=1 Tax=Acetobacterium wieringae TaxID=52694 RepID=UPI0026EDD51E|nr:YtxH domain-containing protein [Acetobacterium wieringae]
MYIKIIDSRVKGALGLLCYKRLGYLNGSYPITDKLHRNGIYGTSPGFMIRSSF